MFYTYQVQFEHHQFEVWRLVEVNTANVDPGVLLPIQDGGYCKGGTSNNSFSNAPGSWDWLSCYSAVCCLVCVYDVCYFWAQSVCPKLQHVWRALWQKQGSWAGTSNYIPLYDVSGTEILIWSPKPWYLIKYIYNIILEVTSQWKSVGHSKQHIWLALTCSVFSDDHSTLFSAIQWFLNITNNRYGLNICVSNPWRQPEKHHTCVKLCGHEESVIWVLITYDDLRVLT